MPRGSTCRAPAGRLHEAKACLRSLKLGTTRQTAVDQVTCLGPARISERRQTVALVWARRVSSRDQDSPLSSHLALCDTNWPPSSPARRRRFVDGLFRPAPRPNRVAGRFQSLRPAPGVQGVRPPHGVGGVRGGARGGVRDEAAADRRLLHPASPQEPRAIPAHPALRGTTNCAASSWSSLYLFICSQDARGNSHRRVDVS